jgi:ATP-dependent Clp protease ATP-binding subunit ClpA
MSRYDRYSESALGVLVKTQDIALREQRGQTESSDLASALLLAALPDIVAIARRNNAIVDDQRLKALNERIEARPPAEASGAMKISQEFRTILDKAEAMAGDAKVEPEHLIRAAWPSIKDELAPYFRAEAEPALALPSDEITLPLPHARGSESEAFRILERFGQELTGADADYPIFGREAELDSMVSTLIKFWKPNPLIIGESGVGKTALVQGLAMRIKSGKVPERLKDARIFELRVAELLAGTTLHGALEENLNQVVEAAEALPNVYLFIDEIHQVVPSFANNPISEVLKPALSSGRIRCIGATTNTDYARYLEKDSALLRRFQTVLVKEPDRATVRVIMAGVAPRLEKHFGIAIPPAMLERALEVSRRYLPMRRFPDKALDVLDRASSRAVFLGESELCEARLLDAVKDIANVVAESGLDSSQGLPGLEAAIGRDILGQDQAIRQVSDAVRVAKMRLGLQEGRPDGAFLLTGPTGVGKTALAISLAKALSGRDDALFRIDMSEFSDAHTAARLLGAPPGYIGYDDAPLLSRAVDSCAGGVLLLDELEKAHAQVHRIFLQILDAGRATDSSGRVLSFASITILATCNVGGEQGPAIGFGQESGPGRVGAPMAALKKAFPIELLNRFDAIVPFRSLDRTDAKRILADTIVRRGNQALKSEYGLELAFSDEALDLILEEGFSMEFGARNMQRAYRSMVSTPLSRALASLGTGALVGVEREGNALAFKPLPGAPSKAEQPTEREADEPGSDRADSGDKAIRP